MSTATKYYELKSENHLPKTGYYKDPHDKTVFRPNPKENLSSFIKRITDHRLQNNYPLIEERRFKDLVVTMLVETTSDRDLRQFFVPNAVMPQLSQGISFLKALAYEALHDNTVSINDRFRRASKCNDCSLHQSKAIGSKIAKKLAPKKPDDTRDPRLPVSLEEAATFKEEASLGVCGACGCPLKSKIRFDIMSVLASVPPDDLVVILRALNINAFEKCWILSDSFSNPQARRLLRNKLRQLGHTEESMLDLYTRTKVSESKNG